MGGMCSSSENLMPIDPNEVNISHFEVMKVVGKGGFGKVNAVADRVTGELLAMKRMKKYMLVQKDVYLESAWRERDVMALFTCPFLVNLKYAFQDDKDLFLLMNFLEGGDLRYYLGTRGVMKEEVLRFYTCQMIMGLAEVHALHVVYRDLKPDNVLLDIKGNLRISDFGLVVVLEESNEYRTSGTAGTSGYQAPEVLQRRSYGTEVDLYSLGVTMFELIEGRRPFDHQDEILNAAKRERYEFQHSEHCRSFISGCMGFQRKHRLGCEGYPAVADNPWKPVKDHPWMADVDWNAVHKLQVKAPYVPEPDRAHCSSDHELQEQFFNDDKKIPALSPEQQARFNGYEYNTVVGPLDESKKPTKNIAGTI